jgi:hypothetical protein
MGTGFAAPPACSLLAHRGDVAAARGTSGMDYMPAIAGGVIAEAFPFARCAPGASGTPTRDLNKGNNVIIAYEPDWQWRMRIIYGVMLLVKYISFI